MLHIPGDEWELLPDPGKVREEANRLSHTPIADSPRDAMAEIRVRAELTGENPDVPASEVEGGNEE